MWAAVESASFCHCIFCVPVVRTSFTFQNTLATFRYHNRWLYWGPMAELFVSDYWEDTLLPKLVSLYDNCVAPETVSPIHTLGLPLRDLSK